MGKLMFCVEQESLQHMSPYIFVEREALEHMNVYVLLSEELWNT